MSDQKELLRALLVCEIGQTLDARIIEKVLADFEQETKGPTGIEKLVCDEITRRQQFGIKKYGQTVADNPLSLRQWLQHAYEESLDFPIYLRRAMEEMDKNKNENP